MRMGWRAAALAALLTIAAGAGIVRAQIFGQYMLASAVVTPVAVGPSSAVIADTAASGATVAAITVTMSNGSTFSGTCSVIDSNTTGPGAGGVFVTTSGCTLKTAGAYSSAYDGTKTGITLEACQSSHCITKPFTLTIASTLACDGETVPAGANAAGFTTCAFDANFGSTFYATTSNWLNCAGASSPIWYLISVPTRGGACSNASIVTDGTNQVLDLHYPKAGWPGVYNYTLQTANDANTITSATVPNGQYFEVKARNSATMQAAGCTTSPGYCLMTDAWEWSTANSTSSPFVEWDFIETSVPATSSGGAVHGYWGVAAYPLFGMGQPGSQAGFDPTVYHVYGGRVTTDGSGHYALCYYLDNVLLSPCSNTATISSPIPLPRDFLVLTVGPQTTSWNYNADGDYYVQWVHVWECAGGATGPCNGTVLTGSP